jgi:hypothetical protein
MEREEDRETEPYRALYRRTKVEGYDDTAHVFAVDYYRPGSKGEDDFSRKEAWFYYLGDDELEEEFGDRLDTILEDLFVDNTIDWDVLTLAPSERKDELNSNMLKISRDASEKTGIEYRQLLRRNRNVYETGELEGSMKRISNLQNSIEITEDVEGLNIILLDNVSIYGFKLAHMTEMLLNAGAERVFCVCLGVTNTERGVQDLEKGVTASTAVKVFGGEP